MKDLIECRKEIDEIDQQLIKLFEQRMKISKDVVTYKYMLIILFKILWILEKAIRQLLFH